MRLLTGISLLLALSAVATYAQRPVVTGGFGNVVFPGGTAAVGVQRSFGNVVFPGTGGPKVAIPGSITDPTFGMRLSNSVSGRNARPYNAWPNGRRNNAGVAYAFPVYIGGGYYDPPQPVQQQPNITVIYPPQQTPVIINQFGDAGRVVTTTAGGEAPLPDTVSLYQAPARSMADQPVGQAMNDSPTGYLIAFKDHTIYSAVAYWVDGETLHYFTSGNNHNQVSLSLIDRELTERLNKEKGTEVRLPR